LVVQISVCVSRQLSFSSPRLSDDRDDLMSAATDTPSCRRFSFYSASSDRLNCWQPRDPGVTGNGQAAPFDAVSEMDTRWQHSSTDTGRSAGNSRFWSDRPSPTTAGSTPVRPSVRQPNPISSRHSNLHNSSDFIMPSLTNFDHTFAD